MDSLNCTENYFFHCHLSVTPKWSAAVLFLRVGIKNLLEKPNQIETKLNSIWTELMGVRLKVQMDSKYKWTQSTNGLRIRKDVLKYLILLESLENKLRLIFKHCDK